MPKWIHDRALHLRKKNPDMDESASWAIATQQAHKLKKTPKNYGTVEGRKAARAKFKEPKKSYVQTANPKIKKAEENSDMPISVDMVKLGGFSDELLKIAMKGRLGEAAKRGVELLAGGKRADPGAVSRVAGKLKGTKVMGQRTGTMANLKSKDPKLRAEAMKSLGARGAAGTAAVVGTGQAVKGHRKTERKQLGRAYVAGARDMYGLSRRQSRY